MPIKMIKHFQSFFKENAMKDIKLNHFGTKQKRRGCSKLTYPYF